MPGLENQEWRAKEFFYPCGNSPHPSSCSQEVNMSYGWEDLQFRQMIKILFLFLC